MATTETQTVRAQAKWVRMSARKGRIVAEHIRGRSVPEARAVLAFTQRAAARELEKVLASAVANAEANHGLVGDELIVHAAVVDEGPTLKRWRARARGRVARIKKHTCHITVTLVPGEALIPSPPKPKKTEESAAEPRAETAAGKTSQAKAPELESEAATEEKPRRTRKTSTSSSKPKASRKES
jgi:ribosomal protein L22